MRPRVGGDSPRQKAPSSSKVVERFSTKTPAIPSFFFSVKTGARIIARSEQVSYIAHHRSVSSRRRPALPSGSLRGFASPMTFNLVPEKGDNEYEYAKAVEADIKEWLCFGE